MAETAVADSSAAAMSHTIPSDCDDATQSAPVEDEADEGVRPLTDKLLTELTAYRTLALREALGDEPDIAFLAALHALCLRLFYRYGSDTCLEIEAKNVSFGAQAPRLSDTPRAAKVVARHFDWSQQRPAEQQGLWDVLSTFDSDARQRLFAHCVSLTVNAVREPWSRRPRAIAHADCLAGSLSLDIAATGWTPTVDNFLGRVTKARMIQAVREAKGADAARRIEGFKKGDMAQEVEQLLSGTNWLPEPLRTPGHPLKVSAQASSDPAGPADSTAVEQSAVIKSESAIDETTLKNDADQASVDGPQGIAAE